METEGRNTMEDELDKPVEEIEQEEEEEDGEEEEEEEEEEEGEEDEEQEEDMGSGLDALSGAGPNHPQFERGTAYEALAEKKRKARANSSTTGSKGEPSAKKAREDEVAGASYDEIMEAALSFGLRTRKSRKPKKRGRRKGSKNHQDPEIDKMMGEATVLYVNKEYEKAVRILNEVVKRKPDLSNAYHTLGLVHKALGDTKNAMQCNWIAASLDPKNSALWKLLFDYHKERGDMPQARKCLSKAITADPLDITLRSEDAEFYEGIGDHQKAAESYEQIVKMCPKNVKALRRAAQLYLQCGQTERSISLLEGYLKDHSSEADFTVIDLLAALLMETNHHDDALKHIEYALLVHHSTDGLHLPLKIKEGICHIHLGNIEKAEICFSNLQSGSVSYRAELINEVADTFMSLEHFCPALKYYHMLENVGVSDLGHVHLKIAQCYSSLKEREKAITFYKKASDALEDSVDSRLALVSLLLEDGKEDDAISWLLPPENPDSILSNSNIQKPWWLDGRIKLMLCHIYRAMGKDKDQEFVNILFPLVRESLYVKTIPEKVKTRLTISVLRKRTKILEVGENGDIFGGVRPLASRSDISKANRARKLLEKKEQQKAMKRAAGVYCLTDDSDDESEECLPHEDVRTAPLPNFLEDEEHYALIIDLCKKLQLFQRYWEALEIINLTLRLAKDKLLVEMREELQSLAAEISCGSMDPEHGFDCVKSMVLERPYSFAAWNCYHKIASRHGRSYGKHAKFLRYIRAKHNGCVPPFVISGHHFTMGSFHQDAAREYLEAHKLLPESHLINLCVGSSLINVSLGFRLQNKHQCIAQALAFLYKNLQLAESNQLSVQEALYNIGRAYHHIGLVTLAASYYEKVLATSEKDYPIPKLLNENSEPKESPQPGYCNLRKEAAYNLHLIYKRSGAIDLARQVLKDHCTF